MGTDAGTLEAVPGTVVEERLIGRIVGGSPGPTLMCVAGIHGNEPAGVHAVRRVLAALRGRRGEMTGDLVAFAGNLVSLERGCRFVDRDLNRAWTTERLASLREKGKVGFTVEDREQAALLQVIEGVVKSARGAVYALDIHTTSGPGGVFSLFADVLPHRRFAESFPIPMVLGLEELVDGTLLNLLSDRGIVAITVETGQHDEPAAIDRAEAAIWISVVASGLMPEHLVPEVVAARRLLERTSAPLPRALEIRYRRDVTVGDGFVMAPGYSNFQKVVEGQVIARDDEGDVVVTEKGRLLMPLYQEQGEDGFFLVREIRPFWMRVSVMFRRAGVSRVAFWLPGVRRVPGTDDEVLVGKRAARIFARQLFQLLGFRQLEDAGRHFVMRRRGFEAGKYLREPPTHESLPSSQAAD